jgi:hypothetical protein
LAPETSPGGIVPGTRASGNKRGFSAQAPARRGKLRGISEERSMVDGSGTLLVKTFLDAMAARDLAAARAMLGAGFAMTFPGGARFKTLEELVAWAKPRYRWVKKKYERFDEAPGADGEAIVYCYGTLYGEWPDGAPFEGIRFIDRFAIAGGKLVDQLVWNDLAESRKAGA